MKRIIITLISIVCIQLLRAQNPLVKQWDYRFGGTLQEYIYSLQQTADGGYILGGYSLSDSSGDKTENSWGGYDYWIIKIDSLGTKQWDKDFGGSADERLYSLQQTTDGGYILGGTSSSGISGDKTEPNWDSINFSHDFWVVKIDSLGTKQWDKDFGGTANDYIVSLQQTMDGGYILGGNSVSGISGDKTEANWDNLGFTNDYWIVKIDALGNKQWDKDLGGTGDDLLASVKQTTDGGYLLAGLSSSGADGNKTEASKGQIDYWVIKTDSLGLVQWDKDFGGTLNDILYSMQTTTDGGAVLAGVSASGISGDKTQANWDNSNGTNDYWVVKIDSLGTKQWDKGLGGTIGEPKFGNISQTIDGGFLVSGISYSSISGNKTENNLGIEQIWVVKTDSLGGVQWDKTVYTTSEDECGYAIETKGGCYLMANNTHAGIGGYKTQEGWGSFEDFWVVKFCDTSIATGFNSSFQLAYQLSAYPNPFTSEITIAFNDQNAGHISLVVHDVLGQEVFTMHENKTTANYTKTIDLQLLSRGIYFLEVNMDGERRMTKIVKE
ncbi:MAG TPA: T9SS type A sorting domain-containing protein [Chitinophagales bacterium]|nr:T9SS type A sorting domain-containing protein [Chitinophagales bacterium]